MQDDKVVADDDSGVEVASDEEDEPSTESEDTTATQGSVRVCVECVWGVWGVRASDTTILSTLCFIIIISNAGGLVSMK